MTKRLVTQRKLREHVGYRYFKKYLLELRGSRLILIVNYYEWKKACKSYHDADRETRFDDAWRWRRQRAIIRKFHNLIVSFRSYFEHIKELVERENINEESKGYLRNELSLFEKSHITCFVVLLRNMMVHRQVYPLISKGIGREDPKSGERYFHEFQSINSEEIEEYINSPGHRPSKERAKPFLKQQPKDLDIESILYQYFLSVNELHQKVMYACISALKNELFAFYVDVADHLKDFKGNIPINRLQLRYLHFLLRSQERFDSVLKLSN